jgi:hypothetical protein
MFKEDFGFFTHKKEGGDFSSEKEFIKENALLSEEEQKQLNAYRRQQVDGPDLTEEERKDFMNLQEKEDMARKIPRITEEEATRYNELIWKNQLTPKETEELRELQSKMDRK